MAGLEQLVRVETAYQSLDGFIPSHPSPGLLRIIEVIPAGTPVALDIFDPVNYQGENDFFELGHTKLIEVDGQPVDAPSLDYWSVLIKACQAHRLPITYLQEFADLLAEISLARVLGEYGRKLTLHKSVNPELWADKLMLQEDALFRRLYNEHYHAKVNLDHLTMIGSVDKIGQKLEQTGAKLAVVSSGKAEGLIWESDLEIGTYLAESLDTPANLEDVLGAILETESGREKEMRPYMETYLKRANPQPKLRGQFERARRAHRALHTGRVIKGREPDYIGTWRTFCPAEGLFEVFITGADKAHPFSGTIEDTLGTARFVGTINDQSVQFKKTYQNAEFSGAEKPTTYRAAKVNGIYKGMFTGDFSDRFTLNLGNQLKT